MCDECEYAEDCYGPEDCVFDENGNLKGEKVEEEERTDPIEEALRNILEQEAERMRNK